MHQGYGFPFLFSGEKKVNFIDAPQNQKIRKIVMDGNCLISDRCRDDDENYDFDDNFDKVDCEDNGDEHSSCLLKRS